MGELLRRRAFMFAGESAHPDVIYQLPSATNTASYDTGVKLFDSGKSFTILCEATLANRNWTGTQSVFGIDTDWTFRLGRASSGDNFVNGAFTQTGNLYTAIICNNTNSDTYTKKCCWLAGRMSNTSSKTERFAVRYNHLLLKVEGFCNDGGVALFAPTQAWFTLNESIVSNSSLKLNLSSANSTVNSLTIYNGLLSDGEINSFLGA